MGALLLAPHADDETLFAFYTMLRDDAYVLVCLDSGHDRRQELKAAMKVANREWGYIEVPETAPDWNFVSDSIREVAKDHSTLIAPAYIGGGHEHHNEIAMIAATLGLPTTWYHTYVRGQGRTAWGQAIIGSGAEMELKRRAMDCYASQIADPKTKPWFETGWAIEYVELPR